MPLPLWALALAPLPSLLALPESTHAQHAFVRAEAEQVAAARSASGRPVREGFYVAFDPDPRVAYATCACDDDGDEVVVFSHALLVGLTYVAADERTAADFTTVLLRTRTASRLPLPRGFSADVDPLAHEAAYTSMLRAILVRELEHLREDQPCSNPTVTHEAGDESWTVEERAAALLHGARAHGRARAQAMPLPPRLTRFLDGASKSPSFATFASWNVRATP